MTYLSRTMIVRIGDVVPVIDGTTATVTGKTEQGEVLALFSDTNEIGILTGCRLEDGQ